MTEQQTKKTQARLVRAFMRVSSSRFCTGKKINSPFSTHRATTAGRFEVAEKQT